MNKFEEKMKLLSAASEVASTIEYYLNDCVESAEEYLTRAREAAAESNCEEEFIDGDYRVDNARSYQRKEVIWKALMSYLEKQYL